MNIHSLNYFISVAKYLNFTKAAEANYVTQPTLSRQIAGLEEEFGVKLIERQNRNIFLTDAGSCFLEHSKKMIREYEQAKKNLSLIHNGWVGTLCIGYSYGTPLSFFSKTNKIINKQYPELKIKQFRAESRELLMSLQMEEVDLIYIQVCNTKEIDSLKVIDRIAIPEEFKVILPLKHKFAGEKSINLNNLKGERFIVPNVDFLPNYKSFFEKISHKYGFILCPFSEKSYFEDIVLAVGAGKGFSIVTDSATKMDTTNTCSLSIENQDIGLQWLICWSKKTVNPSILSYISILKEQCGMV